MIDTIRDELRFVDGIIESSLHVCFILRMNLSI